MKPRRGPRREPTGGVPSPMTMVTAIRSTSYPCHRRYVCEFAVLRRRGWAAARGRNSDRGHRARHRTIPRTQRAGRRSPRRSGRWRPRCPWPGRRWRHPRRPGVCYDRPDRHVSTSGHIGQRPAGGSRVGEGTQGYRCTSSTGVQGSLAIEHWFVSEDRHEH